MKRWQALLFGVVLYSPAGYPQQESLTTSDKELIICHERSSLLKIARSLKMNDPETRKNIFDKKECAIAPKGIQYKKLENVQEAYTLIEIHDRGNMAKVWTFYLK